MYCRQTEERCSMARTSQLPADHPRRDQPHHAWSGSGTARTHASSSRIQWWSRTAMPVDLSLSLPSIPTALPIQPDQDHQDEHWRDHEHAGSGKARQGTFLLVCMYGYMHECMYECVCICLNVCMVVFVYVCMVARLYVCMVVCMYGCMYVWMYFADTIVCYHAMKRLLARAPLIITASYSLYVQLSHRPACCWPPPRRCTVTRRSPRRRKTTGDTWTPSDRAPVTMRVRDAMRAEAAAVAVAAMIYDYMLLLAFCCLVLSCLSKCLTIML